LLHKKDYLSIIKGTQEDIKNAEINSKYSDYVGVHIMGIK
jgi:hypothetical protein